VLTTRANGLYASPSALNSRHRTEIAAFALTHRMPSSFGDRDFVMAGGLLSYWTDWSALRRQSARFVDRILKGANAGDLPVELPSKYELIINRKTASALGLNIPLALLQRADEVIQ
jgi:putative ABC transport system substrate-binding protein